MTLDVSIVLKSMSIIVAPYLTAEQATFPVMGLAASPHRCGWEAERGTFLPQFQI